MEWLIAIILCLSIGGGVTWLVKIWDTKRNAVLEARNEALEAELAQNRKEAHAKKQINADRPANGKSAIKLLRENGKVK